MSPSPPADATGIAVQVAARLLAEGRAGEAAARLEALVAAAPAYPAALVLLARALEASGRDAEALEAWHRAHFLVPNSPLVRRERQRLLEAAAAAPAKPAAEPEALEAEPEVATPSESLAAAPAGDLPDAHLALTEEEAVAPPPEEEGVPEGGAEESLLTQSSPTAEVAAEVTAAGEAASLPAAPEGASAAEEGEVATVEEEPEFAEAPAVEVVDEGEEAVGEPEGAARAADTAEPPVAPPDVAEPPSEPVAGEPESEAAWWRRTPEPAPPLPEEEDAGWSVLEETEAAPPVAEVAEPHVAPPGPPSPPPAAPVENTVEDARVIPAEETPAQGDTDAAGVPPTLADELDALIHQLEDAPRIRPDPTFHGPDVSFDEEGDDDLVSETLARIYAAQRQYAEAAIVYEKLAQQRPEQAEELRRRAAEMRAQGGEG